MLNTKDKKQIGFSMIELLVALVIISVGMLGVATLQLTSSRLVNESSYASQVNPMVFAIIESMHLNATNGLSAYEGTSPSTAPACNRSQAGTAVDIACFQADVINSLPAGEATISESAGVYTITVSWYSSDENALTSRSWEVRP